MLRLSDLRVSLENLIHDFGSTDNPFLGLVINLGLASIGVVVYLEFGGLAAIVGLMWAIINVLGVVKWVIGE